ncbi:MAG: A/G-specific adenine glycosylase [Pseudomonadales bacterium]|nr:A/G-specific adenine glycosylase [Pseudomonadales bacterium]
MQPDFSARLLNWYDQYGRKNLPWQQQVTPYRVWLSEIMLQQTQVNTVIPYFEKFTQRLPTISALAQASEDEVLHLWTGLGYYARARNLRKSAQLIKANYQGELPAELTALEALPGIGRSTAGAIMALGFHKQATILDGNVKRLLARYFGISGWPGQTAVARALWEKAETLTPDQRVAEYTQAIMDIGATLCTRSKPQCTNCPFKADCSAHQNGNTADLPGKKPKKKMPVKTTYLLLMENSQGELLLEKRPPNGIWPGLWSFPESATDDPATLLGLFQQYGLEAQTPQALATFRHTFTHFHLEITPLQVKCQQTQHQLREANQKIWYDLAQPVEIGLTRPVTRLMTELKLQRDKS